MFKRLRQLQKNARTDQNGQLLLELLLTISIAVIILAITGSLVYVAARANQNSVQQTAALGLAQETLEAANASSEEAWSNLAGLTAGSTAYSPAISSGRWVIGSGAAVVTLNSIDYTRSLIIQNVCRDTSSRAITGITDSSGASTSCTASGGQRDSSTLKIIATVSWGTFGNSISQTEFITRWPNSTCTQTVWSSKNTGATLPCTGGSTYFQKNSVFGGTTLHL